MYVATKLESLVYTFLFYCFVKSNSLLKVYSGKVHCTSFPHFLRRDTVPVNNLYHTYRV